MYTQLSNHRKGPCPAEGLSPEALSLALGGVRGGGEFASGPRAPGLQLSPWHSKLSVVSTQGQDVPPGMFENVWEQFLLVLGYYK